MKKIAFLILVILSTDVFAISNDAIYEKMEKTFILHDNQTIEQRICFDLKMLTYYAIHRKYGETPIIYNPKYQEVKIHEVYTLLPDGKKVKLPVNAINEILPQEAADAPAYNNILKMVITHTGLEINCVIHLDYSIISKKGYFPCLMGYERLQQSSPANVLKINVVVPESVNLKFDLLNFSTEVKQEEKNGAVNYEWTCNNMYAYSEEPFQPYSQLFEPYLMFTTKDLKIVYSEFINQQALSFYISEKTRQWAGKLKSESKDNEDFIRKVHRYVYNYIRTYNLPMAVSGYKIQTPDEVFQNCGGTKIEKLCFMNAILQTAGIKADIVLIANGINKEIPSINLDAFNDCMISVKLKSGEFTDELLFFADENESLDKSSNYNRISFSSHLPLFIGMSTYKVSYYDFFANYEYYEEGSKLLDNRAFFISTSDKTKVESRPIHDSIYTIIRIPYTNAGIDKWHFPTLTTDRICPLLLPSIKSDVRVIITKKPSNLKLASGNKTIYIDNEVGTYSFKLYEKRKEIIIEREIKFKKQIVEPTEYSLFKELQSSWQLENNNVLIFYK